MNRNHRYRYAGRAPSPSLAPVQQYHGGAFYLRSRLRGHLNVRPGVRVFFRIARAQLVNAAQQVSPTVRDDRLHVEEQRAYCFLVSSTCSMGQSISSRRRTTTIDRLRRAPGPPKRKKEGHATGDRRGFMNVFLSIHPLQALPCPRLCVTRTVSSAPRDKDAAVPLPCRFVQLQYTNGNKRCQCTATVYKRKQKVSTATRHVKKKRRTSAAGSAVVEWDQRKSGRTRSLGPRQEDDSSSVQFGTRHAPTPPRTCSLRIQDGATAPKDTWHTGAIAPT